MKPWHLLWLVAALAACNKGGGGDGLDKCSVSVGTCNAGSTECGAHFGCEKKQLELKCTPPADPSAKTIDCQCVDSGVLGTKVQIVFPMDGDARAVASTACGWKR